MVCEKQLNHYRQQLEDVISQVIAIFSSGYRISPEFNGNIPSVAAVCPSLVLKSKQNVLVGNFRFPTSYEIRSKKYGEVLATIGHIEEG